MAIEILTKEDLRGFKTELFTELERLMSPKKQDTKREYYKTWEILKAFNMSKGKLKSLRDTGKLPFTRIGKCIYFDYEDIKKILEENKTQHEPIGQGKNRYSLTRG